MRIIFEKEIIDGENISYEECPESEATHKHICGNDEGKSCQRILL